MEVNTYAINMEVNTYAINIIPLMKKFIKKHSWSGELESNKWFRYNYKIVGMTLNTDYFEPRLVINIEISNLRICRHYQEIDVIKWEKPKFEIWSSRKRNECVRIWGLPKMRLFTNLFSFPYRIEIGKIKLVE